MKRALELAARIFDWAAVIVIAGIAIYLGYEHYYAQYNSALLIFSLVLGGLLSSLICCAFHELGHIVFGLFCGFRFNSLRLGPLKIYKDEGCLRCSMKDNPDTVAGATEMLPKNADGLYRKYLLVTAGGPIYSFLFLAGALTTLYFYAGVHFAVYAIVCTSLPCAFHLFFYNALPFSSDSLDTDGALLRGLIKKEPSYLTAVNILAIEGYLYQGFTPSEIDRELYFGLPQLPEDDFNFILLTSYRLMYYLDGNDAEKAAKACDRLEGVLEYVPAYYEKDIASEILFCESAVKGNKELAGQMYPALEKYLKTEDTLQSCRILAAYELYVNGDKLAALRRLNAAEEKAEKYWVRGVAKYEKKLIACLRADIMEGAAGCEPYI